MHRHPWVSRLAAGAAVMFLLSACGSRAASSHAPVSPTASAAATPATSGDVVARQWLAALQAKDLGAMAALFASDAEWEDGATGETFTGGPQAERSGWTAALGMVIAVNDASVLALGDGVAVVAYTLHGPTPAHTSPVDVPMIGVLHVKDGLITREAIYYNPDLAYGP